MIEHKHLIIRADIENPPLNTDVDDMTMWMHSLISKINMELLIGPHTVYCNDIGNEGLTSICAITTSSITLHTWNNPAILQLDVYSCKDFDINIVFDHIRQRFTTTAIRYKFLDRETDLTELS